MIKKGTFSVFLMIGILSVILAIMAFGMDSSAYVNWKTYGGDAYTGIQNAAAATANNISDLIDVISFCGGSILLVGGLAIIAAAFKMLEETPKKECDDKTDSSLSENERISNYVCPKCGKTIVRGQAQCECGQTFDWSNC